MLFEVMNEEDFGINDKLVGSATASLADLLKKQKKLDLQIAGDDSNNKAKLVVNATSQGEANHDIHLIMRANLKSLRSIFSCYDTDDSYLIIEKIMDIPADVFNKKAELEEAAAKKEAESNKSSSGIVDKEEMAADAAKVDDEELNQREESKEGAQLLDE